MYTGLAPIYTSEVAPYTIRGAVGTINQLAVTVGLLLGQVFGLTELLGTEDLWPFLFGVFLAINLKSFRVDYFLGYI